jgi:hypothetical protein
MPSDGRCLLRAWLLSRSVTLLAADHDNRLRA